MALREFVDETGRTWQAWDTYPTGSDPAGERSALARYMAAQARKEGVQPLSVRQQYESGWLTFTSESDRRRLTPIPVAWQDADDATLRTYLARAEDAVWRPKPKPSGSADSSFLEQHGPQ
jgi:hypothetical protein